MLAEALRTAPSASDDFNWIGGVSYQDFKADAFPHGGVVGVLNLDKRTGAGTHWVAFAIPEDRSEVYYYDSLGGEPSPYLTREFKKIAPDIIYFDTQTQPDASQRCGFYAVGFVNRFLQGWRGPELYNMERFQGKKNKKAMAENDKRIVSQ